MRLVALALCLCLGTAHRHVVDPQACPTMCSCYAGTADCSRRDHQEFPAVDPFIHSLDLSGNRIRGYPKDNSYDLNGVLALNISGNEFTTLPEFDLLGLWSLISLDASNNRISGPRPLLPLEGAYSIESVNLSSNSIDSAYLESFSSDTLQVLDLSKCLIESLGELSIIKLTSLRTLVLAKNPLKTITNLTSVRLEELDVSNCDLQSLEGLRLLRLKKLNALNNVHLFRMGHLPRTLVHLDLARCALDTFDIGDLTSLKSLSLAGNRIATIPSYAFSNNSLLTRVDLSLNSIEYIDPSEFRFAVSILELNLSANRIRSYEPYSFAGLLSLETLDLSWNNLETLTDIDCPELRNLYASHCEIANVSVTFLGRLPKLVSLVLAYNSLETLPTAVSASLRSFNLSYNRISDFRPIGSFKQLEEIDLTGNRLTEPFSRETMSALHSTKVLLGNNPWRCECTSPDFVNFYAYVIHRPPFQTWLTCRSPENATGQTWGDACFRGDVRAATSFPHEKAWIPIAIVLISVGFVVCLLFGVKRSLDNVPIRDEVVIPPIEQRRPTRHLLQRLNELPSYEEALLMPKLEPTPGLRTPPTPRPAPPFTPTPLRHITSSLYNLFTQEPPPTTKLSASI